MIDSHCHINLKHFEDDFEEMLVRAVSDGVRAVMNIGFDPETARETIGLIERYPFVFGAVGCHPHDAQQLDTDFEREIRELLDHPHVLGVGEIGLDYYRDLAPREVQEDVFRRMIRLAREKSVPIVIHCRDAFDDVIRVLKEEAPSHRGIFHAFSGTQEEAQVVIDLGFHIGVGGVVTFRNTQLVTALESIPTDRIVLETDSPYLTPNPYRAKRNEPAYVAHTARVVARIKGVTLGELSRITDENFCQAMGIAPDMLPAPVYRLGDRVYVHTASDGEAGLEAIGGDVEELIMCGVEEPLEDLDRVAAVAAFAKEKGWRVRVNTNGQGSHIAGQDVTAKLSEYVDEVVVLFYGTTAAEHDRHAATRGGEEGFEIMCDFARCAVKAGINTVCEFIAVPKFSPEPCRALARKLGAQYDIRMYRS